MKIKSKKQNHKQGFSIVEVIVAASIVAMGFIGVISLSTQNTQIHLTNRNVLVASQLAQEGMELIRNIRDSNWLEGKSFTEGIVPDVNPYFSLDYTRGRFSIASPNDPLSRLYLDGNGYYAHLLSGTPTQFYRYFTVANNGNNLEASCIVSWREREKQKNYQAKTMLYDWK